MGQLTAEKKVEADSADAQEGPGSRSNKARKLLDPSVVMPTKWVWLLAMDSSWAICILQYSSSLVERARHWQCGSPHCH
jgi:hypothetical protein